MKAFQSFLVSLVLVPSAWAGVVINEVAFDEPGAGADWVELYNSGPEAVLIRDWMLDDEDAAAGKETVISLPEPVPPGGFVLVHIDAAGMDDADFTDDGLAEVYSGTQTTVNLAATEDELSLYAGTAPSKENLRDFVAWVTDGNYGGAGDQALAAAAGQWPAGTAVSLSDSGSGYSLGRARDGEDEGDSEDFSSFSIPTPGAPNFVALAEAVPPGAVVVNEIAWSGTAAGAAHEWIELHNPTEGPISLAGWTLQSADGDLSAELSGAVAAGGYFLLERSTDAAVDVPAGGIFLGALSNGGEDLALRDAFSRVIDEIRFAASGWPAGTASPDCKSMERVAPALGGSDPTNWRSNDGTVGNGRDAKGGPIHGTPGARNSPGTGGARPALEDLSAGLLEVDGSRNPFSPYDEDPAVRFSRFSFNFGPGEVVKNLRVVDVRGNIVRTLIDDDAGEDGTSFAGVSAGSVMWDGRDGGGRRAPMGIYMVFLEGTDPGTGRRRRARASVVLGRPR